MIILYIGSLSPNTNSLARMKTLESMGHQVTGINIDEFVFTGHWLWDRCHHFLNAGIGISRLNKEIQRTVSNQKYDLVWVDNKPFVTENSLKKIKQPAVRIINVVTDDAFGKHPDSWSILKRTMPYYDIHFVQRKVNISEYYSCGANLVLECDRSYNPKVHFPQPLTDEEKKVYGSGILFIGTYAPYRAQLICRLMEENYPVKIRGNDWQYKPEWKIIEPNYLGPAVYGEEYRKFLSGAEIVLHFLRRENRDDQDSRTFEIPACGAFMLAERTEKHNRYFEEGKEAEFFESYEELKSKLDFYSHNTEVRKNIAHAGWERCVKSKYSHQSRLEYILNSVSNLKG